MRQRSARSSSSIASQPPMFASGSFFADMVMPSASDAISRTMSATSRPPWPSSRSRMNQAFSANRQASRKSGTEWRSHTARTPCRFSSETGCPPPELLVIVTITSGTLPGRSPRNRSSASRSMLPLKGCSSCGRSPLLDDQVDRLGARELDVGPGRVEMRVVGDRQARPADRREQDLLRRPALVGGDDVTEREQLPHGARRSGATRASRHSSRRRAGSPPTGRGTSRPCRSPSDRSIRTSRASSANRL